MAAAEPGSAGGRAVGGGAVRVAPLDPEQLRRVLERVSRDAAQRAAQAPRLPPPQQLEAICVKVTSGDKRSKERLVPPLATIQPQTERQSQPCRRGSHLVRLCVARPQLLKAQSPGRTASQLCFLRESPQPRAPQVLVQRPLPVLQPVSVKTGKDPQAKNGQGTTSAPLAASAASAEAPVSPRSAHLFLSSLHTMHTERLKKSLKVKTRSGRISRPPKYKAKDYKFIKTEDLADGHLSDSEDYSELSVEEEEEHSQKQALFDVEGCALRPKAFKCQACEKSYIGKGGLARHFKLNPGHGQMEPEMLAPGYMEAKTRCLTALKSSSPAAPCKEETCSAWSGVQRPYCPKPKMEVPQLPLGSQKSLEPRSGDSKTVSESSTANLRQRGTAQPYEGPAGPSVSRSRAQLKESLQHCGREDLLELALPQLAQVVTLYEFLLVKVEKGHRAQPFFPAVYKEFEELHHKVKKLWQGYLSSSGPCSQESLEVNNDKVAESLGITEFLRKKEAIPDYSAPKHPSQEKLEEGRGQKRERELGVEATGERLATVKKPRRTALPTDRQCLAATSGCQEKPRPSCAPAASKGHENFLPSSGGSYGAMTSASDSSTLPAEQWLSNAASADCAARCGSVGPAPLCLDVSEPVPYAQLAEPRGSPQAQVSMSPVEALPEHAADQAARTSQRIQGVCGTPSSGGGVQSLLLGGSRSAETKDLSEMSCFHLDGQQPSPSHVLLPEVTASPLQNILPVNIVPVAYASKTVPKSSPQPGSNGLLSTKEGLSLRSQAGDLNQFPCKVEVQGGQRELGSVAAVGEALAFEISNRCQVVVPQGQEQIFIQASNGLILSHPGTIVSQEEGIVIVTDAGSSALGFSSPAVALQAMEALLAVEAEPTQ